MTLTTGEDWSGAVAALDSALASGKELDDLAVLGNLGNAALQLGDDGAQQHFYTLALSRAREPWAVMARASTPFSGCASVISSPGTWPPCADNAEEALALGAEHG